MDIKFDSEMHVDLIDFMGSDQRVVQAAQVSTKGADSIESEAKEGLIRYLVNNRHASPVEHSVFTYLITAPIFVARESHRHRMCVTGDTVITLTSENNLKNRRYQTIDQMWENWHLGVKDARPTKRSAKVVVDSRINKFKVRVADWIPWEERADQKTHKYYTVGPFDTKDEADGEALKINGAAEWRRRKLPSTRNLTVVSVDEESGEPFPNKVLGVVKNGVKPVYTLTTLSGRKLRATGDHRIFTPRGYVEMSDLSPGDPVYSYGSYGMKNPNPMYSKELRQGIGHWATRMRDIVFEGVDGADCYICGEYFVKDRLHLDHVIPVAEDLSKALEPDNLSPACIPCHGEKTATEQSFGRVQTRGYKYTVEDQVALVEYSGEEEVYDLMVEGPNHNFVGNNIVIHNSSLNEESGRYKELNPHFYVPAPDRKLQQVGKTGDYKFTEGTEEQKEAVQTHVSEASEDAWDRYQELLAHGVTKEVSRMVLPVNIYTSWYITINARSLMNFLSLRTTNPDATIKSSPQREIEMVAEHMETHFKDKMPLTYKAWHNNGRKAI